MTLATLVADLRVATDVLQSVVPRLTSEQALAPSAPRNSWEPGKRQPASNAPLKQGSTACALKTPELSQLELFAHYVSGSTRNCALILSGNLLCGQTILLCWDKSYPPLPPFFFFPKSGEFFSLCVWERSTAPLTSKSMAERWELQIN